MAESKFFLEEIMSRRKERFFGMSKRKAAAAALAPFFMANTAASLPALPFF